MEHLKCWIEVVVVMLVLLNGLGWSHGCVDQEREGLLQLKHLFKYLDWPVKAEENSSDCCEWEMVECNATTRTITKLFLSGGAIEKKLWYLNASYFSPFEQLTSLHLSSNQLIGCAENQGFEILWSRLRKLEVLDLSGNKFSDNIIPSLSGFSSLKSLYLWDNGMGTTLDTKGFESLWRLSNLEQLDLGRNQFNNGILSSLHGLSSLKDLYLWENQLSGIINMQDLNNLVNLKNLDMSVNEITGFICFKGDLEFLDLYNNNLSKHVFASLNGLSHLKSLNLSSNQLTGSIHLKELSGLRNLEDLQLNDNKIEEIVGPEDKTTLNKLKVLGLSRLQSNGKGIVLKSLGALSTLKTIDLGGNILNETNRFEELFNLSSLEELFLSGSNLHKDFLQNHVTSFTSLKVLHVSGCGLKGTLPDRGWCDLRNLEDLDLSENKLEGTLPPCLGNLSSVRILDLSHNQFTGNIASTAIPNLKSIESLLLRYNHFQLSLKLFANHSRLKTFLVDNGNELIDETASQPWTPKFQLKEFSVSNLILRNSNANFLNFLYHQFELRYLYLSRCKFTGAFPNWLFENITRLERFYLVDNSFVGRFQWPSRPNPNMSVIDISHNKLVGHIPSNISFLFPNLRSLNLSENYFQGILPASLGELKLLESLDLSNNQFSGELQEHQFTQNWILKLSNNNFTGRIPTNLFHMIGPTVLQLDGNKFVGEIPDFSPLNGLEVLDLSHNSLSGELPSWMANMSNLEAVFLSDNQFEGPIPSEFCKLYKLQFLDLSGNNLSGSIPPCFSELENLEHLLLRRNKLRGRMTQSFLNMTRLITLDLGENNFIGTIPKWIGNLSNLGILILRGNEFQGDIPVHLCNLSRLNILDLSSNNLSGRLPPCLSHFSFTMGFNLSHNFKVYWTDTQGSQWNIMSSTVKGVVEFTTKRNSLSYTGYILDHMYGIDLSCNRFSGEIPPEFGNLSNLIALNLSHNNLSGTIPITFSKIKQLESLDLSYNNLNGRIPPQLIEVNALAVFSVAYNNLSGPLPDFKSQFGTFSNSSYEGNHLLCGPPLNNSCKKTHFASPPPYPFKEESENDGFMDMMFFWVTFVVTYTVALFALALVLYINSSWRHAWFYYIEVCFNTC